MVSQNNKNVVDLWKQPGGTLGKVGLWVMGASLLYGIYKALPYLITFTQNVFTLALMMMGLGCVLYVAFSPEMRKILKLMYLQICRKITGLIVEIDPIAILENSISEMKKKLVTVKQKITDIGSTLVGMKRKQKEYKKEFEENEKSASGFNFEEFQAQFDKQLSRLTLSDKQLWLLKKAMDMKPSEFKYNGDEKHDSLINKALSILKKFYIPLPELIISQSGGHPGITNLSGFSFLDEKDKTD